MSGFIRDPRRYGDQLVYEALHSKWDRHHARCRQPGCTGDWLDHAIAAGFQVVRVSRDFTALTGPGLTDQPDESALTTDALWLVVTGTLGNQVWTEQARGPRPPPRPAGRVVHSRR